MLDGFIFPIHHVNRTQEEESGGDDGTASDK